MTSRVSRIALLLMAMPFAAVAWAQPAGTKRQPVLEEHTVEWFVGEKGKWSSWAAIRRRLVIEGRYEFLASTKLVMQGCKLDFLPKKGERLTRLRSESKSVRVEGVMDERDGEIVFVIDRVSSQQSDMSRLSAQKRGLERGDESTWYELADWAEQRGTFYEDEALLAEAKRLREGGILVERRGLKADDDEGRIALAKRATDIGLGTNLADELVHEAYRLRWDRLRAKKPTPKDLEAFARQLTKAFAGTLQSRKAFDDQLVRRYAASPTTVYAKADERERALLHRLFYATVRLQGLLGEVDDEAGNHAEIAARIESTVPEFRARATVLRETDLERRLKRVPSMTREEVTAFSAELKKADRSRQARQVIETWVAKKEDLLRDDGADGLLVAADYYEAMLDDRAKVIALLKEAHTANPEAKEPRERLERLGLRLRDGEWVPVDESRRTIAELKPVEVTPGMSAEKVRSLLGSPRAVTRIASAGHVNEAWIYGARGASGVVVHFLRERGGAGDQRRVVKVTERSAP